jgi:hypothetical protein
MAKCIFGILAGYLAYTYIDWTSVTAKVCQWWERWTHRPVATLHVRDRKWMELEYEYHDRLYVIPIRLARGPARLYYAETESGMDITPTIQAYLGPNEDTHGLTVRLRDIGMDEPVHLVLTNEEKRTLIPNDVLQLDPPHQE